MSDKIRFPASLLFPVGKYLQVRLSALQKRLKDVDEDDPFKDTTRLIDNASPDADAAEQFGHARASALRGELTKKVIQTKKALSRIKWGKYGVCEDCGKMIDTDRLVVYPEATKCVTCEAKREE